MYSVASLLRTPLGPHYLSLIHVQCSLFIKDTIGPHYPSLIQRYPSSSKGIGLHQLGHYKKCPYLSRIFISILISDCTVKPLYTGHLDTYPLYGVLSIEAQLYSKLSIGEYIGLLCVPLYRVLKVHVHLQTR